jgi:hypothetical protein
MSAWHGLASSYAIGLATGSHGGTYSPLPDSKGDAPAILTCQGSGKQIPDIRGTILLVRFAGLHDLVSHARKLSLNAEQLPVDLPSTRKTVTSLAVVKHWQATSTST